MFVDMMKVCCSVALALVFLCAALFLLHRLLDWIAVCSEKKARKVAFGSTICLVLFIMISAAAYSVDFLFFGKRFFNLVMSATMLVLFIYGMVMATICFALLRRNDTSGNSENLKL